MIEIAVRRPVATAALYVALLALGAYSFGYIPVELLPDVSSPHLTVTAGWSRASPESMEALVTSPLESAARQVRGVEKVTSISSADPQGGGSLSRLDVEFARGTRMEFARLDLGERIAALAAELPPGVRPAVQPYVPREFARERQDFLSWQLHGPYTTARLTEIAERRLKPAVLAVDGISAVSVRGGEGREILIELDRRKLGLLGITPEQVRERIEEVSAPRPAGSVELARREVSLTVRARAADLADLREIVVATPRGGPPVHLREVARVLDHAAEPTSRHRIDGQPTISVIAFRQAGTNAIELADRAKAAADSAGESLPPGVRMELDQDQSVAIRKQLADLRLRALASAAVILLVLLFFLRSLGPVFVVFATIALSVLIAVFGLYLGGFTLNVLTLAGLAWGFGLAVDNGIVVLENVQRRRAEGERAIQAAIHGTRQVVPPVLAATATTTIVLVPFLFLQGELRIYYLPLAYAVGFSILASLFVGFTFVPTLAARLGEGGPGPPAAEASRGAAEGGGPPLYLRGYRALLSWTLDHPVIVALLYAGALAGSWHLFDRYVTRGVKWSSFWGQETYIQINIQFPRGADLERTDRLARSFEAKLRTLPEVRRFETTVQPRWASIHVTFPKRLESTQAPVAIKEQMVSYSYGFSGVDVRVYGFGPSFYGGGSSPPNYSVDVLGYNYLQVQRIADDLAARLKRFSRIRDVDPNATGRFFDREKELEYFLEPDRRRLAAHGLTVQRLLQYVAANVRGTVAERRLRLGGEEVAYAIKLSGYRRFGLRDLSELRVPTGRGSEVRLADVARVEQRDVLARIVREDHQYRRTVAWEFRGPRKLGDLVRDAVVKGTGLPPGYRIETAELFRWSAAEKTEVYLALGFSVLLVYMVTAALFESLAAPLVVLLTIPLALIGVFLIFFYADATFTRTAYIGVIMMGGIVVNNAILIVYHIGELRERLPGREAILTGTLQRVRPILMTTATTVFGLLPLVLFAGSQDENIWNALALATIGGLLSSTLFVLVAIPLAYRWIVGRAAAEHLIPGRWRRRSVSSVARGTAGVVS